MASNTVTPPIPPSGGVGATVGASPPQPLFQQTTPAATVSIFGSGSIKATFSPNTTGSTEGSKGTTTTPPTNNSTNFLGGAHISTPIKVASVQFDQDGDVILVVKNPRGTARFRVNSSILCMTSPVFRAMLGRKSQFKEAKALKNRDPNMEPVEVSLGDDDPNGLCVVLRILHHQYDLVPQSISGERLYQIAIICDKYDLQQALSCWLDRWISGYGHPTMLLSGREEAQIDQRLFMAYTFRNKEAFRHISQYLIRAHKVEKFRLAYYLSTLRFEYLPKSIVDKMMAAREVAILAMISSIRNSIATYEDPAIVRCQHKQESCDSFVLGFLIRAFSITGLYPEEPSIRSKSVLEIRDIVVDLEVNQPDLAFLGAIGGCCLTPTSSGCKQGYGYHCVCMPKCTPKCTKCKKTYQPVPNANHVNCLPLKKIVELVKDIKAGIKGLEYTDFVAKNKDEGKDKSEPSMVVDLWDSLEYI